MKKEINSKSRRKWIMGGLAAFASVALLTTGFAVWVVGVKNVTGDGNVNVDVDTARNDSVRLKAELDDNQIYVGEKTSDNDNVSIEKGKDTDFNISFKTLTIEMGKPVYDAKEYTKVVFSIGKADAFKNIVDQKIADNGNKFDKISGRGDTYFDIAMAEIPLDDSKFTNNATEGKGTVKYTFTTEPLTMFKWGDFFGNVAPSEYYAKTVFAEGTGYDAESPDDIENVVDELNAMHDKYVKTDNSPSIQLHIELAK